MNSPARALSHAIRHPKVPGRPALMPYLMAGLHGLDGFAERLLEVSDVADAIELGVPFSDPTADGPVIQAAARRALEQGVTLSWILQTLRGLPRAPGCPIVLMSYANPLHAYGYERLLAEAEACHIAGFILPDIPWEESGEFRDLARDHGLAVISLVTPVTPPERLRMLTADPEGGFAYAVTVTGITGGSMDARQVNGYLDRVRGVSRVPVCAGFGIRTAEHVRNLTGHADGAIVGSALIEAVDSGLSEKEFLRDLREKYLPQPPQSTNSVR